MNSIEEKAKAYDGNYKVYTELINRLEDVKEAIKKQNYGIAMDILCKPYPNFQVTTYSELAKSEDERIIQFLISEVRGTSDKIMSYRNMNKKDVLAWLERQGNLMKALQISNSRIAELVEEKYNLEEKLKKQGEQKPVEPQQDMLSQEKYAKAVDECVYGEQKPAWSEEDEIIRKALINLVDMYYGGCIDKTEKNRLLDFLKSLRPQNTWKPSEEQIKVCKEVYADILSAKGFNLGTVNSELNRLEEQLKKLKG